MELLFSFVMFFNIMEIEFNIDLMILFKFIEVDRLFVNNLVLK